MFFGFTVCGKSALTIKVFDGFDRVVQTLDQIIQPAEIKNLLKYLALVLIPQHSATKQRDIT